MAVLEAPAEIQHGRHHHHSAYADALLALQGARELGHAKPAIALADEEFGGDLPVLLLHPFADGDGQGRNVAVDGPEAAARIVPCLVGPAIASADRIEEDEVGEGQPALRVGNGRRHVGRRQGGQREPPRAHRAEIEIGGRGAGTAIHREGERPRGRIGSLEPEGDEADFRQQGPALAIEERHAAERGVEGERLAADVERVARRRLRRELARVGLAGTSGLPVTAAPAFLSALTAALTAPLGAPLGAALSASLALPAFLLRLTAGTLLGEGHGSRNGQRCAEKDR